MKPTCGSGCGWVWDAHVAPHSSSGDSDQNWGLLFYMFHRDPQVLCFQAASVEVAERVSHSKTNILIVPGERQSLE